MIVDLCIPATVADNASLHTRSGSDVDRSVQLDLRQFPYLVSRVVSRLTLSHLAKLGTVVHQNAIGPHQWNVPVANFTDPVLRVRHAAL